MHYNNSQKLPPKYTGSKQLVTQLLNLMEYHFVQSEHRNMIANMENSTTSNVNERPSICVYSQPTRWDARPTRLSKNTTYIMNIYKITKTEAKSLKVHEIRQLKKTRHTEINKALVAATQLKFEKRFFISLPTKEAHEKVHPTGIVGGMAQRVHPMISKKIEDLVKEGITEVHEVKRSLHLFVKTDMRTNPPSESNRSYYPTNTDIRNHIDAAKAAIQLSKFDQISLKAMYKEWTKERKQGKYFFRPYIKIETSPDTEAEAIPAQSPFSTAQAVNRDSFPDHFTQTLMWIQQEEWQQNLMTKYGNTMSLIGATYKSTKYDLPLFFVTVRTNVGYKVVAHFIVQSETTEQILEALNILKGWNTDWQPQFFMCDYSEAEISAIERAFPGITVYICDFHREQAWTRWTRGHKNGLTKC